MAEQMNFGSTLVLLTLDNGKKTLVNVEAVLRFSERERHEGSQVYFKGGGTPVSILEDPIHVRKLITGAKLADLKELMNHVVDAQGDMVKKMMEDLPPEMGGDGRNPFGDGSNDFDG